jgi:hypothetical protein
MADVRHEIIPCDTLMREPGITGTLCSFVLEVSSSDLGQMNRYPGLGLLWSSHSTLESASNKQERLF